MGILPEPIGKVGGVLPDPVDKVDEYEARRRASEAGLEPVGDVPPIYDPPVQEVLLNDFIAGLLPGLVETDPSRELDPFSRVAGLAGMIMSAGGAGGAIGAGRGVLGRMAAHGGTLGAHSAATAASHGADTGDIFKAGGIGAGLGAGLSLLHSLPEAASQLATKTGEAGLWATLEAALNPDAGAGDILGAAIMGPLASRVAGMPYRVRYEPIERAPAPEKPKLLMAGEKPPPREPSARAQEVMRQSGEQGASPSAQTPAEAARYAARERVRRLGAPVADPVKPGGADVTPEAVDAPQDALQSGQGESAVAKAEYRNQAALGRAKEMYDRVLEATGSKEDAMQAASTFLRAAREKVAEAEALEQEFRAQYWNEPGEPRVPDRNIDDLGGGIPPQVEQRQIAAPPPTRRPGLPRSEPPPDQPQQPKNPDVTLGVGLGGGQDLLKNPTKYELPKMQLVKGNPIDHGAYRFRQSGDILDWTNRTTPDQLQVSDDFKAEVAEYKIDVRPGEYGLSGRRKALPAVGQGEFGSAIDRHIKWPNEQAEMAKAEWASGETARAVEAIGSLTDKQAKDLTRRAEDPAHDNDPDVMAFRKWDDALLNTVNRHRIARGEKPINRIKNHVMHIPKTRRFRAPIEVEGQRRGRGTRGRKGAAEKVAPFAKHRAGKLQPKDREMDIRKIMDAQIRYAAEEIFDKPVHELNIKHAEVLEKAGLTGSAELITMYSNRTFGGQQHPWTEAANQSPVFRHVFPTLKWVRRRLTDAVFPLNLNWSLSVQPSSTGTLMLYTKPHNQARALPLSVDPTFREFVFTRLRGGFEKNRQSQGVATQDTELPTAASGQGAVTPLTKYEVVRDWGNKFAKEVEKSLYAHAAAAAMFEGRERGLEGRKLTEFMAEVASNVHNDYNKESRAGWQQSPEATSLAPFMTWLNDVAHNVREVTGVGPKTGHWRFYERRNKDGSTNRPRSIAEKTGKIIAFLAFMKLWEEYWAGPVFGRFLFRDFIFGQSPSPVMPADAAADLAEAIAQSVERTGEFSPAEAPEPLAKWATTRLGLSGAQVNKVWTTYMADQRGGDVLSRSGKSVLFNISGDEPRSYLLGPWATGEGQEAAKEYYDSPLWKMWEATADEFFDNTGGKGRSKGSGGRRR